MFSFNGNVWQQQADLQLERHAGVGQRASALMVTLHSERDPRARRTQPRPGGANLHRYISIRMNGACLRLCCLRTCVRARARVRGCVPVDLAAAPQKVGLRAWNSRPSVWPPLERRPKRAGGRRGGRKLLSRPNLSMFLPSPLRPREIGPG